jgi:hypothetical protein
MLKLKIAILLGLIISITAVAIGCSESKVELEAKDKALNSFKAVLKSNPDKIGYHKVLKHWNFKMPSGELFEWSKNVGENKADYAMVLLADPFIKAGLDTNKLKDDNWLFKAAEVEDGKQLPNRLIHPFNIDDKAENSNGWEDALRRVFNKKPSIISFNDNDKVTVLSLGEGFSVELKENTQPQKSVFTFRIKSTALVKAGLDINKLNNSEWTLEGNDTLVRVYKLEYI